MPAAKVCALAGRRLRAALVARAARKATARCRFRRCHFDTSPQKRLVASLSHTEPPHCDGHNGDRSTSPISLFSAFPFPIRVPPAMARPRREPRLRPEVAPSVPCLSSLPFPCPVTARDPWVGIARNSPRPPAAGQSRNTNQTFVFLDFAKVRRRRLQCQAMSTARETSRSRAASWRTR